MAAASCAIFPCLPPKTHPPLPLFVRPSSSPSLPRTNPPPPPFLVHRSSVASPHSRPPSNIPASAHSLSNQPNNQSSDISPLQLEPISSEPQFDSALSSAQQQSMPIVVDWMATWCRKCIYLKPKLEKLAEEFQSEAKFYYVDVNVVPQGLVKRAEVTKMPTIQVWKNGEKCDEVIGGHKAWLVIDEVREMLQKHLK